MRCRLISALILLLTAAAFLFFYKDAPLQPASNTPLVATTTPDSTEARRAPDGWREYRNTAYHFSLLYPEELEVKEYPEKGNAITITFQNVKKQEGFQIFIVPYEGTQVSEERFRQDLPSGARADLTDVAIDGATGAAFYSANAVLGETREVWFVYNGFLYEATTLKSLDTWLEKIMQTWEFV